MYININEVTYISGSQGIYDGKINNNSVRYARNAINNYKSAYNPDNCKLPEFKSLSHIIDAAKDSDVCSETFKQEVDEYIKSMEDGIDAALEKNPKPYFNLKYAQLLDGKPDTIACIAAAFEEMGKRTKISVDELTNIIKIGLSKESAELVSAKSLDVNKDGNIDLSEYATSLVVEDMLSNSTSRKLSFSDVKGVITNAGENELLTFVSKKNYNVNLIDKIIKFLGKKNYQGAYDIFKNVHKALKMKDAEKQFLSNPNNMV